MKLRQPRKKKPGEDGDEENESGESHGDDSDNENDNSQRVVKRKDVSPDLTLTLMNVSADEVCRALIDAWERDQLADLVKRVNAYLSKAPAQPTSAVLAQPSL